MRSALLLPERREGKTKVIKQQYLPFTVLKLVKNSHDNSNALRCNSSYRLRYWNSSRPLKPLYLADCCNSTYRLRYAPKGARQQRSSATMRSAHLKCLSKAKVKQKWWSNSAYRSRYWNISLMPLPPSDATWACCNSDYRSWYWNLSSSSWGSMLNNSVATAPTVYGMRRRVRDSRGAKRRWGPHISSTWTKRR